jgi:hypothetical protein
LEDNWSFLGLLNFPGIIFPTRQGYLISTGEPKRHYISEAVRHVQMRQGTIGIKVGRWMAMVFFGSPKMVDLMGNPQSIEVSSIL